MEFHMDSIRSRDQFAHSQKIRNGIPYGSVFFLIWNISIFFSFRIEPFVPAATCVKITQQISKYRPKANLL